MTVEQLGISRFKVRKEDHDEMERDLRTLMDFESAHPDIYHFSSTRFYTMDVPGSPDQEYWMFIDHFKSHEDYVASLSNAIGNPDIKEGQKLGTRVLSHTVGFASSTDDLAALGGPSQIEHWVEVPSLRVDNQGH